MITKISNFTKSELNINFAKKNIPNNFSNPAFLGQDFPSGHYEDDEIELAKKYLKETGSEWQESLKKTLSKKIGGGWKDSQGLYTLISDTENIIPVRIASAIISWGLSEVINTPLRILQYVLNTKTGNEEATKKITRIVRLMEDLKKIK